MLSRFVYAATTAILIKEAPETPIKISSETSQDSIRGI